MSTAKPGVIAPQDTQDLAAARQLSYFADQVLSGGVPPDEIYLEGQGSLADLVVWLRHAFSLSRRDLIAASHIYSHLVSVWMTEQSHQRSRAAPDR